MATKIAQLQKQIDEYTLRLNKQRTKVHDLEQEIMSFVPRRKNMQALAQHGLTIADAKNEILGLVVDDYYKGPKQDHDPNRPGYIWEFKKNIENMNLSYSESGLRVLAFAYKYLDSDRALTFDDENDLIFLGLIAMMDPPREESAEAVKRCKEAGITPIMITGDHIITASAIAKRIGILNDGDKAVLGSEIDKYSDEELKDFVKDIRVYARVSPEHKIRIVKAWQERGNIVAMTGDGVNDAPALKQADIGVSMGITGTEVAKDASDMILSDDNFVTIVSAVAEGRRIYDNILKTILFLLSTNIGEVLLLFLTSVMAMWMPAICRQALFSLHTGRTTP